MKLAAAIIGLFCTLALGEAFATTPDRVVLPSHVTPLHYDITITPNVGTATFTGTVATNIEVHRATHVIVLNAVQLSFSKVTLSGVDMMPKVILDSIAQTATFSFEQPIQPGRYLLSIAYSGQINPHPAGLFYLDYDTASGKKRAIFTQFENSDARRFVPCWDEPDRKATFTLTATVPSGNMALSNTSISATKPLPGGLSRVTFQTTPKMSSYLLFFGLGDFERITRKVNGVTIGVVFQRGASSKATFALDAASHLLPFYEDYFGIKFPLPKLDLVAGPGQSQFFSAMENWGAIFYFERAILIDARLSTQADRMNVYITVAHEMAHQWFGDLVTMDWWDDLWLNEGFASWMEVKATDHFHPEWKLWLRAQDDKQEAMAIDARAGTHPIVQHIRDVLQANEAFDSITYLKGMAVIRMLENYVGEDGFRSGVRAYIKAHTYGNTVSDDLWRKLDKTAAAPVSDIAHDFTLQAGVPLIRVVKSQSGIHLAQDRFSVDGTGNESASWLVPVTEQTLDGVAWRGVVSRASPADIGAASDSITVVNAGQGGYFRTLYSPAIFKGIVTNFSKLGIADELGILSDSEALGLAGYEPVSDALQLSQQARPGMDPLFLDAVADQLSGLVRFYRDVSTKPAYEAYARAILQPLLARVGWASVPNEDPNVTILRSDLLGALSNLDDPTTVAKARGLFEAYVRNPDALSGDQRASVLSIVAAHADAAIWEQLHVLAKTTSNTLEKRRYYALLGSARNRSLAQQALGLTLTNETEITQRPGLIRAVANYYPDSAFDFAVAHMAQVNSWLEPDSRNGFVVQLLSTSIDPGANAKLKTYTVANVASSARQPALMTEAAINYTAKVRENSVPMLDRWVASHHH